MYTHYLFHLIDTLYPLVVAMTTLRNSTHAIYVFTRAPIVEYYVTNEWP